MYDYDLFVIGGGSGGIATARRAAEYGAKVGLAENDRLGGTCVNRGCIPKKLMVYASHFPEYLEEAEAYGWSKASIELDWPKMITVVNNEVHRLNGIYQRMLDNSKVKLFRNYASFVDNHTIQVGNEKVTADKILVAVGGYPIKPNIPGIEYTITSDEIFNLPKQPEHIVIFGGGYIGVEFACIMHGLGSKVTQIIRKDLILNGFEQDLRVEIQEAMIRHGINVVNNSQLKAIKKTEDGLKIILEGETTEVVTVDQAALSALGRRPNLEKLGLENTGIELEKGAIKTDKYSQTSEPNIYAVGDCTNTINLTPVAINEGRAFADTHFGGKSRIMAYDNIPTAIFSTPEAATVGLTEEEARAKYGEQIKVYRSKFRPMYYTLTGKEEKTLMKLVVDTVTDKVLGAHMVGNYAAEIIQGVAIALKMGATKADFDATVGIHPSSAEEFVTMR
jgi:glutathione reductase (NADPH)